MALQEATKHAVFTAFEMLLWVYDPIIINPKTHTHTQTNIPMP